jgi:HEPN domain-containing protein
VLRYLIGFILGGLAFMALAPILSAIAVVLLVGIAILALFVLLMPGGWLIMFGVRSFMGFFGRWVIPLILLCIVALFVTATSTSSPQAGLGLSFVVGGLAGILAARTFFNRKASSTYVYRPVQKTPAVTPRTGFFGVRQRSENALVNEKPPEGWSIPLVKSKTGFLGDEKAGILVEALREGVVVMGEADIPAARALVKGAVEKGLRVVVIGSPYIAPKVDGVKLVRLGVVSFNIMSSSGGLDPFSRRVWAENIAVPLVVAAGLDTAEAGMVVRFLQKFAGSRLTPDDVDKIVAEYGPTSSARLKDALGILTIHFGEDYPPPSKLFSGNWRVLVIDTSKLSQSLQLFATMYLLYEAQNLFPGCVLVFDGAELGLPEQSILPYDARHVWLRTLKQIERLRSTGFIMVASTGLLAPELLDLADTYVMTRGLDHMRRALAERMGVEVNLSTIPLGHAYVFTRVSRDGMGYLFGGRLVDVEHADIALLEAEAEREATLLREEMLGPLRDTVLYADFADMAEACYRVLRAVKHLSTPTPERVMADAGQGSEKALKQLLEKGYVLVDPAGVLGLTTLGEQALRDWDSRVRRHAATPAGVAVQTTQDGGAVAVQAGIQVFQQAVKPDMSEASRFVVRAREELLKGNVLKAVGLAYKAANTALKQAVGTAKGHLPDLAEKAVEKGILKLEEDEVRRLYAANIEAKRLSKQVEEGESLSEEDVKRMRDAAELLISLAERVIAFFDKLPGGEDGGNEEA